MVSDYEWLKKHTDEILQLTYPIERIEPKIVNEFGPWAIVKLISLKYFVDVYTTIISKQDWVNKMRYIDLLAGSGLSLVSSNGDLIAGSSIIAAQYPKKRFDHLHLIEMDSLMASALEKRLEKCNISTHIIPKDCNQGIDDVIESIGDSDHYLAFVDCQSGMEPNWLTIQKLLSKSGDMIFNFQSAPIYRVVSQWQKNRDFQHNALNQFYGDETWKGFESRDDCLNGYIRKIRENSNRDVIIPCRINGPGSFYYDLLIATRRTTSGSPYMNAVRTLKNRVERLSPKITESVLDILKGRKQSLDSYFG